MAVKLIGCFVKVVAVVFTSVVAPVLVNLAIKDIEAEDAALQHKEQTIPPKPASPTPNHSSAPVMVTVTQATQEFQPPANVHVTEIESPETIQVVVKGTGRTAEEALQDALRGGLARAIAAQVGAETWARNGQFLIERISSNSGGLIRSWKEIGGSKEWRLKGTVHYKDVAVEVERHALVERLRSTCPFVPSGYPSATRRLPDISKSAQTP